MLAAKVTKAIIANAASAIHESGLKPTKMEITPDGGLLFHFAQGEELRQGPANTDIMPKPAPEMIQTRWGMKANVA